ncbi:MAG: type II toxin-antitoxin system MqsA family antitoxin [candidate division KSB1 bacterium]|nr:type II toxin-antitoxin system MqsA family antitoxin [candidate division KSB1 bacterium]MDZ7364958.1 type II toxin-antitoxin system MqsA family antitoxin [candidate division KSB1 bacterium]MDZ7403353.1 type II toxin-antitoxin system MqsA family antitoxin [candidate division KSB1 bacterium]
MAAKYDKCDYCGGSVREKRVTVDLRVKGKLYVFDNVPVGICQKCGERYYRGPVLERLEELAGHKELFKEKIQVPRFDLAEAMFF